MTTDVTDQTRGMTSLEYMQTQRYALKSLNLQTLYPNALLEFLHSRTDFLDMSIEKYFQTISTIVIASQTFYNSYVAIF